MTNDKMPREIWAVDPCYPDDPGAYILNGNYGGEHYTNTQQAIEELRGMMKERTAFAESGHVSPNINMKVDSHNQALENVIKMLEGIDEIWTI